MFIIGQWSIFRVSLSSIAIYYVDDNYLLYYIHYRLARSKNFGLLNMASPYLNITGSVEATHSLPSAPVL